MSTTLRPTPLTASKCPGRTSPLVGTGLLCRHIVRRDRVRMSIWALALTAFIAYFSVALSEIFDESALGARAAVMRTPSGIVMGGPGYGLDDYDPMVAVANEGTTWIVLTLAIMAILHVVRHTRGEEDSGRAELVRAGAVGRMAPAVATLLTLLGHLLIIALLGAAATMLGEEASAVDGLGLTLGSALSALVFGAVALVTSQVMSSARAAAGTALAVFALAFVVRSAGDLIALEGSTLSWFSPVAWAQQMRAFVDLRWWPILLSLAATLILLGLAGMLAMRRDVGQGMVAVRAGRATAPATLQGPITMAWRQQRAAFIWTALGMGLLWFATGTMMKTLDQMASDLVADNPALAMMFGSDPDAFAAAFLTVMLLFVALCVAAYALVQTHQHCRSEESSGRLEVVLAAPVSRSRWLAAQLLIASLGTAVLLALSIGAIWFGAALVGVEDPTFGEFAAAFATYLPAVLVFCAFSAALFGWAPRLAGLSWLLLAAVLILGMFRPLLDLPEAVQGISPLYWVPDPFVGDDKIGSTLGLAVVVMGLLLLALLGFHRRGIQTAV